MLRILLFLGTNVAIIALISITFRLLGIENLLAQNQVDLDMNALLIYSAIIGFSGSLISLFMSKFMAKKAMRVHLIDQPQNADEVWLLNVVQRQAQAAGIRMPEVGIFEGAPNAFATGWNKNSSLVAVSTGLLQNMDRGEVEAVLGHEVSHVANGDMVTLALIQGVVNTFVVFLARIVGMFVDSLLRRGQEHSGPGLGYFVTSIIADARIDSS